jgi:hypothetical protein
MNSAHECPEVALAAATKSLAVEFTSIVEMQDLGYAMHRPIQVNRKRLEPFRFGQTRHAEGHGDRSR